MESVKIDQNRRWPTLTVQLNLTLSDVDLDPVEPASFCLPGSDPYQSCGSGSG